MKWRQEKTFALVVKALRDLDYDVKDKLFLEKVLDCEFFDSSNSDKAIFYTGKNACLQQRK